MSDGIVDKISDVDLVKIKDQISAIKDLQIEQHSDEFEKIHNQLKRALTNLGSLISEKPTGCRVGPSWIS